MSSSFVVLNSRFKYNFDENVLYDLDTFEEIDFDALDAESMDCSERVARFLLEHRGCSSSLPPPKAQPKPEPESPKQDALTEHMVASMLNTSVRAAILPVQKKTEETTASLVNVLEKLQQVDSRTTDAHNVHNEIKQAVFELHSLSKQQHLLQVGREVAERVVQQFANESSFATSFTAFSPAESAANGSSGTPAQQTSTYPSTPQQHAQYVPQGQSTPRLSSQTSVQPEAARASGSPQAQTQSRPAMQASSASASTPVNRFQATPATPTPFTQAQSASATAKANYQAGLGYQSQAAPQATPQAANQATPTANHASQAQDSSSLKRGAKTQSTGTQKKAGIRLVAVVTENWPDRNTFLLENGEKWSHRNRAVPAVFPGDFVWIKTTGDFRNYEPLYDEACDLSEQEEKRFKRTLRANLVVPEKPASSGADLIRRIGGALVNPTRSSLPMYELKGNNKLVLDINLDRYNVASYLNVNFNVGDRWQPLQLQKDAHMAMALTFEDSQQNIAARIQGHENESPYKYIERLEFSDGKFRRQEFDAIKGGGHIRMSFFGTVKFVRTARLDEAIKTDRPEDWEIISSKQDDSS